MSIIDNFHLHMEEQIVIWNQTFPNDSVGYLGIVEIPHGFIYATVTSNQSLEHFKQEISSFPYHYAWKISELEKVTTFVDKTLDYINQIDENDTHLEDEMLNHMISKIRPYLMEEVDPYQ